jgi:hypothetical protein
MRGLEPSSRAGKSKRRQFLVQRIEHVGDAQFLDVSTRREIAPEIAQHVLPGELAVGDLVELLLQRGGEVVFDIAVEEALEEGRDEPALGLGDQLALVDVTYSRSCSVFSVAA